MFHAVSLRTQPGRADRRCGGACVARPSAQLCAIKAELQLRRRRDVPTLQVLHSNVANLSDKFFPFEPVFPLVSSHLEPRKVKRSRAGILRKLPRLEKKKLLLLLLLHRVVYLPTVRVGYTQITRQADSVGAHACGLLPQSSATFTGKMSAEQRRKELQHLVGIFEVGWS